MNLLKTALILNALSCIIFGILFISADQSVNEFIGNEYSWLTPITGVILVVNGCHLILSSQRSKPICLELLYFVAGDLVWVAASIILIFLGVVVTTNLGSIVTLLIAGMVGSFAVLQIIGYKRTCMKII